MVLGHARGGHGMMTVLLLDVPIEITVKVSLLIDVVDRKLHVYTRVESM
jgi:hypothetical protein